MKLDRSPQSLIGLPIKEKRIPEAPALLSGSIVIDPFFFIEILISTWFLVMGGKLCNIVDGAKPAIVMVVAQLASGGVQILYKLAINDGMNTRVLIAYRYIFATAFISSLAFILERW